MLIKFAHMSLRAAFVIYSSYSSMILFSSKIFVVLLLWLCHLLVTLLTAIVFKRRSRICKMWEGGGQVADIASK